MRQVLVWSRHDRSLETPRHVRLLRPRGGGVSRAPRRVAREERGPERRRAGAAGARAPRQRADGEPARDRARGRGIGGAGPRAGGRAVPALAGGAVRLCGGQWPSAAGGPAPRVAVGLAPALGGRAGLAWAPGMISIKARGAKGGLRERWKVAAIVGALGRQ